jgi:plastocyanin
MRARNSLTTWVYLLTSWTAISTANVRADADVSVRYRGFSPSSVTISPGETVWFTVMDDNGPYVIQSDTGAWTPWYLFDYGDYVGIQFNQRGDYGYHDIYTGNRGIIHVGTGGGGNTPPSLTIDNPVDGAVFTEPAAFDFAVTASDLENGLVGVEFYVAGLLVDVLYGGPFTTPIANLAAGDYTLTAIAYDNASASTTKSVSITVQPWVPTLITLSQPTLISGQFRFQASGLTVGKQVVLQSCASLGNSAGWISLQTNLVTSADASFVKPAVAGSRFFRVLQLP